MRRLTFAYGRRLYTIDAPDGSVVKEASDGAALLVVRGLEPGDIPLRLGPSTVVRAARAGLFGLSLQGETRRPSGLRRKVIIADKPTPPIPKSPRAVGDGYSKGVIERERSRAD